MLLTNVQQCLLAADEMFTLACIAVYRDYYAQGTSRCARGESDSDIAPPSVTMCIETHTKFCAGENTNS